MKKIASLCLAVTMLFLSLICLWSCGDKAEAPDGMQLVRGGEDIGYYFYAPEEWTVSNSGKISAAYASKVDTTSASITEAEMPSVSIPEYFKSEMAKFTFPITLSVDGEKCNFGNSDEAYKYVYSYTYKEIGLICMQILSKYQGRFYIFTFTSYSADRLEGQSYYSFYLEKVQSMIDNFKFVEKKSAEVEKPEYEKDEDGYNLVSDKEICGFELYLPESYTVDSNGGIVSATNGNGSTVSLTKAMTTGVTVEEYWKMRKENLELFIDQVSDPESGEKTSSLKEIEVNKAVDGIGNEFAFSFEYTYVFGGRTYHVYQVLFVDGWDGYVYTFTAYEDCYNADLAEAKHILTKVKY